MQIEHAIACTASAGNQKGNVPATIIPIGFDLMKAIEKVTARLRSRFKGACEDHIADAVHDAVLKAVRHFDPERHPTVSFVGFCEKIAERLLWNIHKKMHRAKRDVSKTVSLDEEHVNQEGESFTLGDIIPDPATVRDYDVVAVYACAAREVGDEEIEALHMLRAQSYTVSEVTEVLGHKSDYHTRKRCETVGDRLRRAFKRRIAVLVDLGLIRKSAFQYQNQDEESVEQRAEETKARRQQVSVLKKAG